MPYLLTKKGSRGGSSSKIYRMITPLEFTCIYEILLDISLGGVFVLCKECWSRLSIDSFLMGAGAPTPLEFTNNMKMVDIRYRCLAEKIDVACSLHDFENRSRFGKQ